MDFVSLSQRMLEKLPPRLATRLHRGATRIGWVRRALDEQYEEMLAEAPGARMDLSHLALPGGFPNADDAALAEAARLLHGLPAGAPILVDCLALGAMPVGLLDGLPGPLVALCHHPLALETGIDAAAAERFRVTERAALAASARVIAASHATARILLQDYGVAEAQLTVAPPGSVPPPTTSTFSPGLASSSASCKVA